MIPAPESIPSPWGLEIIGSDFIFWEGGGGKRQSTFSKSPPIGRWIGLAGANAAILKRLIAVNTFVSPWGLEILGSDLCFFVFAVFCWGRARQGSPFKGK